MVPQAPQLPWSLWVSAHLPLQRLFPTAQVQALFRQVAPAAHAVPHAPQFSASESVLTHEPAQLFSLAGHWVQSPSLQDCDAPQALPQEPQWAGSEKVSTHLPPHSVSAQLAPPVPDAPELLVAVVAPVPELLAAVVAPPVPEVLVAAEPPCPPVAALPELVVEPPVPAEPELLPQPAPNRSAPVESEAARNQEHEKR